MSTVPARGLTDGSAEGTLDDSSTQSDSELIRRCQQGDTQSFRYLYRRYQRRIRSTLYQLCGATRLDDLVQEVFLRAWRGLPRLRQTSTFSTWIYRITWNVASDERRQLGRARSQLQLLSNAVSDRQAAMDVMELHYQDLVKRGLEQLGFDHRSVLVLHDLEDLPQKQVASILEIPVGTVKSRLFHARKTMRQFLEGEGVQP